MIDLEFLNQQHSSSYILTTKTDTVSTISRDYKHAIPNALITYISMNSTVSRFKNPHNAAAYSTFRRSLASRCHNLASPSLNSDLEDECSAVLGHYCVPRLLLIRFSSMMFPLLCHFFARFEFGSGGITQQLRPWQRDFDAVRMSARSRKLIHWSFRILFFLFVYSCLFRIRFGLR